MPPSAMKHTQFFMLSVWFALALLSGCRREESPQVSAPPPEMPTAEQKLATHANAQEAPQTSENWQKKMRQPKQKYPKIIIPPDQPNPVGDRLKREFSGLHPKSKEFTDLTQKLWSENSRQLSETPLQSSNDDAVSKGLLLPKELESWKMPDSSVETSETMILGLSLMPLLAGDAVLIGLMKQRADRLPPTVADLIVHKALSIAIDEIGPDRIVSTFENWEPLSNAANPVYRLLALRAARRSTSRAAAGLSSEDPNFIRVDAPAKLGFYLRYLNESDPTILSEAIAAIATVPTPEARQAIEKFQVTQQQRGDAALVQVAADALRTQEIIAQGTR